MYGLIGRMMAAPGQREALLTVMQEGQVPMAGCLSYVLARDPGSEDGIWITEVWDSKQSHAASLHIPEVRETISRARPMIASFAEQFETEPVGGVGI
ncbi:putative quinol monooxygenase [Devosia sp. YIM 151766]|uniref:putative quinol monooxygenase n=1 Tax=Devosia sp. YIM 151766 TaxID=3017325 RepID=UPI00255CCDD4|nr:putative quinol monooxygenase [Devosia sp. YIM 151766]WIY51718.1 putative quinol monooxygenase [Devosia sp. YIM 151766]